MGPASVKFVPARLSKAFIWSIHLVRGRPTGPCHRNNYIAIAVTSGDSATHEFAWCQLNWRCVERALPDGATVSRAGHREAPL